MIIDKDEYKIINEDYKPVDDIFNPEDDKIHRIKQIIYNDLDDVDRVCILLYAELGTYRKLGAELQISTSSAFLKIKNIRQKIYDKLNTDNPPNSLCN